MRKEIETPNPGALAGRYYRLFEGMFQALCPEGCGLMNLGVWPAATLGAAQANLFKRTFEFARSCSGVFETKGDKHVTLVEAGSGWGGSRELFEDFYPGRPYVGLNISEEQIRASAERNLQYSNTRYITTAAEQLNSLGLGPTDLFSVEAAFHFENKSAWISGFRRADVRSVTFADLCMESAGLCLGRPSTRTALHHAWSVADYADALRSAGYQHVSVMDIGATVFSGAAEHFLTLQKNRISHRQNRIFNQFVAGVEDMLALHQNGALRYAIVHAH